MGNELEVSAELLSRSVDLSVLDGMANDYGSRLVYKPRSMLVTDGK